RRRWPQRSLSRSPSKNCSAYRPLFTTMTDLYTLLESDDVLEKDLFMALRVNARVHLAKDALRVDHERRPVPVERSLVVALRDAQRLEENGLRIGEELDRERELRAEVLVRRDVVGADAHDMDPA